MAVLYCLGFDCEQDEAAARQIASAFTGFEIDLSELGHGKTDCDVEVFLSELGQGKTVRDTEVFLSELGVETNRCNVEVFLSDLGQGKFDCNVEVVDAWWTVCVDFPNLRSLCATLQRRAPETCLLYTSPSPRDRG